MIVISTVILVAAGATILWYSPLRVRERLGFRNFFGAALLVAWAVAAAGAAIEGSIGDPVAAESDLARAMLSVGQVSWPGNASRAAAPGSRSTDGVVGSGAAQAAGPLSVASVRSLIGGLESRLQSGPADPNGWALLAQSYAFVGQADRAEAAIVRAVELGFDEVTLRSRVDGARRDAHPTGDWVEQTLRR